MPELLQIYFEPESTIEFIDEFDEDVEFVCNQPEIIAGAYEGSKYLLVECTDLPDGLKIYANSGEYGVVKDFRALIILEKPLLADADIWVYVNTSKCNVESCKFSVGSIILGSADCQNVIETQITGTLTGEMICNGVDFHQLEYDQYGNKVLGPIMQVDCFVCGGIEPNCIEEP